MFLSFYENRCLLMSFYTFCKHNNIFNCLVLNPLNEVLKIHWYESDYGSILFCKIRSKIITYTMLETQLINIFLTKMIVLSKELKQPYYTLCFVYSDLIIIDTLNLTVTNLHIWHCSAAYLTHIVPEQSDWGRDQSPLRAPLHVMTGVHCF